MYTPLVVYVFSFQVNSSQTVMLIGVGDDLRLMVKFNIAVESHPTELVVENEYVPLLVYVVPFQVYVSQIVILSVNEVLRLMVKFKVAIESQPTELVVVNV